MISNEWLTLEEGVARATMSGMSHEAADRGIATAVNAGVIGCRTEVTDRPISNSPNIERNTVHYVKTVDLDEWVNRIKGTKKINKGGAPPTYDWTTFYFEIIRRANTSDGLPEKQVELIDQMLQWASTSGFGAPALSTVSDKISKLFKYLEKNRQLSS